MSLARSIIGADNGRAPIPHPVTRRPRGLSNPGQPPRIDGVRRRGRFETCPYLVTRFKFSLAATKKVGD